LKTSRKGIDMWGEGASDLWGHLEGEDAARLKAIRERLRGKSARLNDGTSYIDRLNAAHSLQDDDVPDLVTVDFSRPY
jgi:hypothetical protein